MAQVKLEEEEDLWEPQKEDHSALREFKEEPDLRGVQRFEDNSSILCFKKEDAEEVGIKTEPLEFPLIHVSVKSEEEEPETSTLHQTVKEEPREDTVRATAALDKHPESEEHGENSSDTDDSEDWTPAAERPTPQTPSEEDEQLQGPAQINQVSAGGRVARAPAKEYICPHCERRFRNIDNLRTHKQIHTGDRPFICSVCAKRFTLMGNLNAHMRRHTGERPFRCTVCEKCFTLKHHLNLHVMTHTGEKPFKCSVCSKCFTRVFNLNAHMKTHEEEKPFKCAACSQDFRHQSDLRKHTRTHIEEKRRCDHNYFVSFL